MTTPLIEIVASTLHSCIEAEKGGAGRIELCAALDTAGVTPSLGLFLEVKKHVKIPVFVMIRPREGDFIYTDTEIKVMEADIALFKQHGADGFVFGCLTKEGNVDVALTSRLVEQCEPLPVTFHRAFDLTPDLFEALEDVIEAGCTRILTSGGMSTINPASAAMIQELAEEAEDRIIIMPGGGVTKEKMSYLQYDILFEYHHSAREQIQSPHSSDLFEMNYKETVRERVALIGS